MIARKKKPYRNNTPLTDEQRSIVEENVGLIFGLLNKWPSIKHCGISLDDLESAGLLGLVIAARGYNPNIGIKFSTYASRAIYTHFLSAIKSHFRASRECVSIADFDEDENDRSLVGQLEDVDAKSPHDEAVSNEEREILNEAIANLPAQERMVIVQYYQNGLSRPEIGKKIKRSRQRVYQILSRAEQRITCNIAERWN